MDKAERSVRNVLGKEPANAKKLVPPTRIERAARGLGNRCSIRLSYGGNKSYVKKQWLSSTILMWHIYLYQNVLVVHSRRERVPFLLSQNKGTQRIF